MSEQFNARLERVRNAIPFETTYHQMMVQRAPRRKRRFHLVVEVIRSNDTLGAGDRRDRIEHEWRCLVRDLEYLRDTYERDLEKTIMLRQEEARHRGQSFQVTAEEQEAIERRRKEFEPPARPSELDGLALPDDA